MNKTSKANTIEILNLDDKELLRISKENLLSLSIEEMKAIQQYYKKIGRNPTDVELETIAQTWSEHCKHKTFTGIIEYKEIQNSKFKIKNYDNLLKQTVFKVTKELNKEWCVSVFKDNAGIIEFNKNWGVAFKVETHNHPSALEPYGGAGTGIGGVIRDILGVGLGAKPVLNTDVFCFGPIDYPYKKLKENVLHPRRIFKGVVAGVRDYGNRMGIPTANGAVLFDKGYVYNPLVYCGTVGIMPKDKCFKKVLPGDLILAVGGRTGRDGIHGATFSSTSLDKDTEVSAVQIGNPIVEKKVLDTVLQARDKNLYRAITDCGAGGFSSAIGELGANCGARVYLERAPLKYEGLAPWEIWVSEAQERMVLAVPKKNLKKILKIFSDEDVEATVLGEFTNTGRLEIFYHKEKVCDLDMNFLHKGLPRFHLKAIWKPPKLRKPNFRKISKIDPAEALKKILASPNVCSKEWVIRQYDHEVQGTSILKPLQGRKADSPGDACVLRPILDSFCGIAVSNGINPRYGFIDPYWMTASAIDEALRNITCVGGDIERTALLDNFCWGNPKDVKQLGTLVRSAQACYDIAKGFEVPFISGKDSLNNEYVDEKGKRMSIPGTILISAISVIPDVRKVISMDFKKPGNLIYIVGITKDELGGSHLYYEYGIDGNSVPKVEPISAKKIMKSLNVAIRSGVVKSCHDCSEGGLAVAIAEMCFAGGFGAEVSLKNIVTDMDRPNDITLLFSESNSRFIVEVSPEKEKQFQEIMKGNIFSKIGNVTNNENLVIYGLNGKILINENIYKLKDAWQSTLKNV